MNKYLIPVLALSLIGCIKPGINSPISKTELTKTCKAGDSRACNLEKILETNCPKAMDVSTIQTCWEDGFPINRVWFDSKAGALPPPPPPAPTIGPTLTPTPLATPAPTAVPTPKH